MAKCFLFSTLRHEDGDKNVHYAKTWNVTKDEKTGKVNSRVRNFVLGKVFGLGILNPFGRNRMTTFVYIAELTSRRQRGWLKSLSIETIPIESSSILRSSLAKRFVAN